MRVKHIVLILSLLFSPSAVAKNIDGSILMQACGEHANDGENDYGKVACYWYVSGFAGSNYASKRMEQFCIPEGVTNGQMIPSPKGGIEMVRRKRRAVVLTDDEVKKIRKQAEDGYTVRHIAINFGVGHAQIHRIITGKSRGDVK